MNGDETLEQIGKAIAGILVGALQSGLSREEALEEAAQKLRRGEVVSDELWLRLNVYIEETERFENEGG